MSPAQDHINGYHNVLHTCKNLVSYLAFPTASIRATFNLGWLQNRSLRCMRTRSRMRTYLMSLSALVLIRSTKSWIMEARYLGQTAILSRWYFHHGKRGNQEHQTLMKSCLMLIHFALPQVYSGRVAYENLRSLPVGLVSYRCSSHLTRTSASPTTHSYRLGTTPSYSLTFLFS